MTRDDAHGVTKSVPQIVASSYDTARIFACYCHDDGASAVHRVRSTLLATVVHLRPLRSEVSVIIQRFSLFVATAALIALVWVAVRSAIHLWLFSAAWWR